MTSPVHVAIVARRRTRTFASQAIHLHAHLEEANPGKVRSDLRIVVGNATEPVLSALQTPADVLVVLGHTTLDDGQVATVLDVPAADLRGAVHAHAVVLNTCYLGWKTLSRTADTFVTAPTPAVVCAGPAPYTHGPILLPPLLTSLITEGRQRDWHSKLRNALDHAKEQLATERPRMDRERWEVTTLG